MPFRDAFPILHTPDLSRATAFYRERFGFDERYRFPQDGTPEFVVVTLDQYVKSRTWSPPLKAMSGRWRGP